MALGEPNWAMLPDLPLCLIFEKLIALSDFLRFAGVCKEFLRFAGVCKEWRLVVLDKHNNNIRRWLNSCSNQLPFLMVQTPKSHPSLYSLATQQSLLSFQHLSMSHNFRCSGSSYGWLAFATGTDYDVKVTLYNPFTRDEISDLPHIEKQLSCSDTNYFIVKVILSANPSVSRDDLYIVAIYGAMGELALLKYGQKSWTYIDFMDDDLVSADVIFFGGLLYAVTNYARVASIDIIGSLNMKKQEAPQPRFILQTKAKQCSHAEYLVESSQGDLLVVRKFYCFHYKEQVKTNFIFEVFKIVAPMDENGAKLEEVKSLGNDAFFVGDNHSMSVSVLDFPEYRRDSIYFTDDGFYDTCNTTDDGMTRFYMPCGPIYNGIYNLKDGTTQKHYQPQPEEGKHMLPPIWIIPSPNF